MLKNQEKAAQVSVGAPPFVHHCFFLVAPELTLVVASESGNALASPSLLLAVLVCKLWDFGTGL